MALKIAFLGTLTVLVAIQACTQACQSAKSTAARQHPTLDFIPKPKDGKESNLIWLKRLEKGNYLDWYDIILETLNAYYLSGGRGYTRKGSEFGELFVKRCTYVDGPNEHEVCDIDLRAWGDCSRESYFNYYRYTPCIFLKLNQIPGWKPDMYDDPDNLPAEMPTSLKDHIGNISEPHGRKNVWISCDGETPADKENLGPVTYYPTLSRGFPAFYFPNNADEGYLPPLVAIKLGRPRSEIPISIECRAWAKNINRDVGLGSVRFEVLIN